MLPCGIANADQQLLRLGRGVPYGFLVFANAALDAGASAERAVMVIHGVRRNADDYYAYGLKLLDKAGLSGGGTLLLAPNFLTPQDGRGDDDMPLWERDQWMHGTASSSGRQGIDAFAVLDDLLLYLADRQRFPALKEIVLIGHSAGGQLIQRYSILGDGDKHPALGGIHIRYVVSSPSSYLYFEGSRLRDGVFKPVRTIMCPSFERYRYGLERAPAYLVRQGLDARQVFRRYAVRDVTFMVGARDNNPWHRILDRSCGAEMQGAHRVERQLNFLRYEAFLSDKWGVPIHHRQITAAGIGHNAARLLVAPSVVDTLFSPN